MNNKFRDFQDQIFFDNLGDEGPFLKEKATVNIIQYYTLLDKYLKSVKENARNARFTWKIKKRDKIENDNKTFDIELAIENGENKAEKDY